MGLNSTTLGSLPEPKSSQALNRLSHPGTPLVEIIILLSSANLCEEGKGTMYHISSYNQIKKRLKLLVSFQLERQCTKAHIISVNMLYIY